LPTNSPRMSSFEMAIARRHRHFTSNHQAYNPRGFA
jgi:hypothetical protein